MNFRNELTAMAERMFTDELLETILCSHQQEYMVNTIEEQYKTDKEILYSALDEAQLAILEEYESLCMKNIKYALQFAFSSGVLGSFQQFFGSGVSECLFDELVRTNLLTEPQMKVHADYYARRTKMLELYTSLYSQLSEEQKDSLTSIESTWEDRLYAVLRYAFYLGYRGANKIQLKVTPFELAKRNMLPNILLTEHELGFTHTVAERE